MILGVTALAKLRVALKVLNPVSHPVEPALNGVNRIFIIIIIVLTPSKISHGLGIYRKPSGE